MVLDRWPDKTPVVDSGFTATPIWQRWLTALVIIVNGLATDAASLLAQVVANTAAIAGLQPTYGLWTPTDASGAALGFTTASGQYIKMGQQVSVSGIIVYPVTANGANAAWGGLPFTSINNGAYSGVAPIGTNAALSLVALVDVHATTLQPIGAASFAPPTNAQLSGTTHVFSVVYRSVP